MQRQHQTLSARGALSPQLSHASEGPTQPWDRQPDFQRRLPAGRRPAGFVHKPAPVAQQVVVGCGPQLAQGCTQPQYAWGICGARVKDGRLFPCWSETRSIFHAVHAFT